MNEGSIPVLSATGRTVAETWERSLVALHDFGTRVRTQYDAKDADGNFTDPPSIDATMMMTVEEPLAEPMIHLAFPGGPADLEEYCQEVCDGIKDHWVRNPNDPTDKRWEYTYHARLTNYECARLRHVSAFDGMLLCGERVDQLDALAKKLAKQPYSRQAQAITWRVGEDESCYDPPCLQSIWCRILPDDHDVWRLNMNVVFRSRDAYDAAFMNIFALVWLMRRIADRVEAIAGRKVELGRYTDISHSYHIYGKRLHGASPNFEDGFLKMLHTRTFEERTANYADWLPMFEEARPAIVQKIREQDEKYRKG